MKSATEGEIVNAAQIVRIDMVETGETLYRHAKFHVGAFSELSNVLESPQGQKAVGVVRSWLRRIVGGKSPLPLNRCALNPQELI